MSVDLVTFGIVCADVMVRPVETLPERGKLALVPQLELHVGGLSGVTAAVFSRLGGRSAFVGALGQDGFGDYIAATLQAKGVDVSLVRRTSKCGSSATTVLVSEDGERTFLHHMGANAELCDADAENAFPTIREAKVFHWGGPSVTPHFDGEPMGKLLERIQAAGVKTSMDTCFDGTGTWFPLIEPVLPHLDIVMSSLEEAREFTGKQEPEEIADFYLSFGPEVVMIKLGAQGLLVKNAEEMHVIPGYDVPCVDTTGAGDAACGGFLYGLMAGWDVAECGRFANAVGALTVQVMGGAEGVQSFEHVRDFMQTGRQKS